MLLPQLAGAAAALAPAAKELLELIYKSGQAISKLADQAAKLQMLSEETELSLSSLQKVDYAAQLKGL